MDATESKAIEYFSKYPMEMFEATANSEHGWSAKCSFLWVNGVRVIAEFTHENKFVAIVKIGNFLDKIIGDK